jgi:outer membrane protein TolC
MKSKSGHDAAALLITAAIGLFAGVACVYGQPSPIQPGSQLTLKRAIEIAIEYHPRRQQAIAQAAAANEQVGVARSALLPQVTSLAEYLRATSNGIGNTQYYGFGYVPRESGINHSQPINDFNQSSETFNSYMGGVSLSQFLFDFGRRRGYVAQKRYEAAAARADEKLVDLDMIFEVSRRYFELLEAQQMVRIYQTAIDQRKFHLHEAQLKADAGLRPKLDVFVTQAELSRAELHLVDARNGLADAKVGLDNAMGLGEAEPDYKPVDVLAYGEITDNLAALLHEAFEVRPDLQELENQARAMGAEIVEYRSDFFPTASAIGGYNAMGTGLPAVNNFNVGLVITWPMFNGFLTTHQIAGAEQEQHAIQHAIEDLRQQIILQVKTAFLNWQASVQRIHRAKAALDASQVELELANKRYQTGLTNIVELEDAQRHFTEDDAEYANSLYGFSLQKAAVDQATGRSLTQVPGL